MSDSKNTRDSGKAKKSKDTAAASGKTKRSLVCKESKKPDKEHPGTEETQGTSEMSGDSGSSTEVVQDSRGFMGTDPIGPLLAKLSIPAMVGMIVNALYNFVDTIFVGQGVGALAIAGLSIAFPLQMLIGAFAQTFGVGSASIISRRLGEGNEDAAARAAGNAITGSLAASIIFMIVGLIFLDDILILFGASTDILPFARDYVQIILLGAPFLSLAMASNGIIRAEGQAKVAMKVMILATGLNIILDPIGIFVFKLGIQGVAIATVLSQFVAFLYVVRFFRCSRSTLPFNPAAFRPNWKVMEEILTLGVPAFVRQAGTSLMVLTVNNMLKVYGGDLAIAAYGMINRLLMFVMMPMFGLVQGFQPIAGYNYGARKISRVKEVMWKAMAVSTLMGLFAWAVLQLFPRQLLSVFSGNQELLDIAVPALRITLFLIPLIGVQAIGATLFQALGKRIPSLFLSLSRQFLFLIPLILLLPRGFGINGIWGAFPAADLLSTLVTGVWVLIEMKHINKAPLLKPVMASKASE